MISERRLISRKSIFLLHWSFKHRQKYLVSSSIFYHCSFLPLHIGVLIYYSRGYANCLENALDLNFSIWSWHRWRFTCTWFVCGERSWLHWIGSRRSFFSKVMREFLRETKLGFILRCRVSAVFLSIFQTGYRR